jgi:hypothetical protein
LTLNTLGNKRGQVIDCRNETVQSSPGLYCQRESTARLCASVWIVATYLSLQGAGNNVDAEGQHAELTVAFFTKHSNLWKPNQTVCHRTIGAVKREYELV